MHKFIRFAAFVAVLAAMPAAARAQEGVITGTVVDATTLQPLPNVQVGIDRTPLSAITNASGQFRIARVPGAEAPLTVTLIGYRQLKHNVRVGSSNVRLMMAVAPVELDAVVITGTAAAAQRRSVGNSVASVKAGDIQKIAPAPNLGALMNGRTAGVVATAGTGQIGSGPRVRIRGGNSFSLNDQPLLYIDGIRIDNDVATGPRSQGTSAVISRLNDINPEDIESFEIIKGPAAATLYGTEAANGVIQIITKKGRSEGPPKFDLSARFGSSFLMNAESKIPISYGKLPSGEVVTWNPVAAEAARGTPLFQTGVVQNYTGSMSGGSATTRYYVSGSYDKQTGIELNNSLDRFTTRANLIVHPSTKVNGQFSFGYTQANTELPNEGSSGRGLIVNADFGSPLFLDTPKRGFLTAPPEVLHSSSFRTTQFLRRFTQSGQVSFDAFPWLSQKLTFGLDVVGEDDESLTKRDESLAPFFNATTVLGSKSAARHDVTYTTADYSITAKSHLRDLWSGATSAGFQFYRRRDVRVSATGREFPAPNLETVLASAITTGSDDFEQNTTVGVYVQQQVGWRDVAFLTGAVRVDNNNAFGENFDLVAYPKVSGTYVVSDRSKWSSPLGINTLKLRAAYGQSGQQPRSFAALRTYQPVTGGNNASAVTPQFVGNPDLQPERGAELEGGFEAGLFKDRAGIDFTYYTRKTTKAILEKATAPSMGFPGTMFVNAGAIQNRGFEVMLKGTPVSKSNFGLDVSLNLSHNTSKVLDLGGATFYNVVEDGTGFITPLNSGRHMIGYPLGGWWGKKVVSATVNANGIAQNIMCDPGGAGGGPIDCTKAPEIFLGRSAPNFEGSFSAQASFLGRFRLYGLLDFKTGMYTFNNTFGFRCQTRLVCKENVLPLESDPVDVAVAQSNRLYWNTYLHNATYAKLREVSVSYTVPENLLRGFHASSAVVTVSGRNMHTFTGYPGADPENVFLSNQFTRTEQSNTPPLSQVTTTFRLTF